MSEYEWLKKQKDEIVKKQADEAAALVKAATLKAVGESLASLVTETGMPLFIDYKHVEALRQGKMPEGW